MKLFIAFCLISLAYGASLAPYVRPLSAEQVYNISNWKPGDKGRPWQMSGQIEGDMVLGPQQFNGLINVDFRWANHLVYYEFDPDVTEEEREIIRNGLSFLLECVFVQERTTEADHVYITVKDEGCWSNVGHLGGRQYMNLQRNVCFDPITIRHELMHTLGFVHEHNNPTRDSSTDVLWQNIQQGQETNFIKYSTDLYTSFGRGYDPQSLMHYDEYAFSKNGEKTMESKDGRPLGPESDELSDIDRYKVKEMYVCP